MHRDQPHIPSITKNILMKDWSVEDLIGRYVGSFKRHSRDPKYVSILLI